MEDDLTRSEQATNTLFPRTWDGQKIDVIVERGGRIDTRSVCSRATEIPAGLKECPLRAGLIEHNVHRSTSSSSAISWLFLYRTTLKVTPGP